MVLFSSSSNRRYFWYSLKSHGSRTYVCIMVNVSKFNLPNLRKQKHRTSSFIKSWKILSIFFHLYQTHISDDENSIMKESFWCDEVFCIHSQKYLSFCDLLVSLSLNISLAFVVIQIEKSEDENLLIKWNSRATYLIYSLSLSLLSMVPLRKCVINTK